MKVGDRVMWHWQGGAHSGNGPATVIAIHADARVYAARLRLDATGETMDATPDEIRSLGSETTERPESHRCAELLYASARHAIAHGLARSEYDMIAAFMWGQAAADYGHEIVAGALDAAREAGDR